MAVSTEVGTWALAQAGTYIGGGAYTNQASAAQNDAITFELPLAAGTWDLRVIYRAITNGAIITAALDGTTVGTIDTYAVAAPNQTGTVTGISVATSGVKTLSLTAATKHASSSGYRLDIHAVAMRRTA
jgi:hypothetical protein